MDKPFDAEAQRVVCDWLAAVDHHHLNLRFEASDALQQIMARAFQRIHDARQPEIDAAREEGRRSAFAEAAAACEDQRSMTPSLFWRDACRACADACRVLAQRPGAEEK